MRRYWVVALAVFTLLGVLSPPPALAQAPAPKVTITGVIDQVTSASGNLSTVDLNYSRAADREWYARTRGRFDIIGEVGKAKGVLGLEIDATWGQTGTSDQSVAGAFNCAPATTGALANALICPGGVATTGQRFGTSGGFDLNTDVLGLIELKWLYTEFPLPELIPVPSVVRLGAQPWAATYKPAVLATGDFAGVNLQLTFAPNLKANFAYAQIEDALSGARDNPQVPGTGSQAQFTQARGEDFAIVTSLEISPLKGLDIRPIYSYFYANGATSSSARQGRGGLSISGFNATWRNAGGLDENRHTIGVDAKWTAGPFYLDPTFFYQFGDRESNDTTAGGTFTNVVRRKADRSAWFADVRGGWRLGPLLLEAMGMYTTGNKASDDLRSGELNFFEPISTDTSYYAGWAEIFALGIDYLNILYATNAALNPGVAIGYDRYGRAQVGARASYAFTPEFSTRVGMTAAWTAEAVDTSSNLAINSGLTPVDRDGDASYLGTELNLGLTYRFAPGLAFDLVGAYLLAGGALQYQQRFDGAAGANVIGLDRPRKGGVEDVWTTAARVRYTF